MKRRVRKTVKKYLTALVPLVLAALFALNYAAVYTRAYPESDFEHRYTLIDFIARNWFYVGAAISGAVIAVMLIDDFINYLAKRRGRSGAGGKGAMGGMAVSK